MVQAGEETKADKKQDYDDEEQSVDDTGSHANTGIGSPTTTEWKKRKYRQSNEAKSNKKPYTKSNPGNKSTGKKSKKRNI